MAQQTIGIGTVANDGTGDPIRTAMDKVNDNFTELYGGIGAYDFWSGSEAEYTALGTYDDGTLYFTTA